MNIISRIKFPISPNVSGLYIRWEGNSSSLSFSEDGIFLKAGDVISLNTYFNSFYEKFYAKYTNLNQLYYLLDFEGDFKVFVYREKYCQPKELVNTFDFLNCNFLNSVKIPINISVDSEKQGRVYLEIISITDGSQFKGGNLVTEQFQEKKIALAIITCTFKKEKYVKQTIETILKDDLLKKQTFKIFIVDNGKTLNEQDFLSDKVKLIPNRNVGGSGGFTRGLIEAIEEQYTHFLFMDDDIVIDSESIYRLYSLYKYAKSDFAVAGSMLDLFRQHLLYEAGAKYGFRLDNAKLIADPFVCIPLKHNLYLQDSNNLNYLLTEDDFDYGGFWLFAFSQETLLKIGLSMPFFIKVDDMEFGLRIKNIAETPLVAFPSISVWHEPFYNKKPIWDNYYYTRNTLICNSIHKNLSYLTTIKRLTRKFLGKLFVFDYNSAEILITALEHFLKGPEFLSNQDTEILHPIIIQKSKLYPREIVKPEEKTQDLYQLEFQKFQIPNFLKMLFILVTLNGHIIPDFLLDKKNEALILDFPQYWSKVFTKTKVIIYDENLGLYRNEINKKIGMSLFIRWITLIVQSFFVWRKVNHDWKICMPKITSIKFWKNYLEINNKNTNIIHINMTN